MGKIKAFINRHKSALAVSAVSASLMVSSALSAFAADGESSNIKAELSTQFGVIKDDLIGYAFMTIGIAIPVIAAFFGIRKAVSFFTKLTRKD